MKRHLQAIADSYDKAIDLGRMGIDQYRNFPTTITDDPDFHLFLKMQAEGNLSDSGEKVIQDFLCPQKGLQFIDLGCCLNLMFRGYDLWPSTYHGVDISPKTIALLEEIVHKKQLRVGSLICCSLHHTPYATDFFDIGACIGSLEYYEKAFVKQALKEIHRILESGARFVLDVPDLHSPEFQMTMKIESFLERPDKYDLSTTDFEKLLNLYFKAVKKEKAGPMLRYFLVCKKIV